MHKKLEEVTLAAAEASQEEKKRSEEVSICIWSSRLMCAHLLYCSAFLEDLNLVMLLLWVTSDLEKFFCW